MIVLGIETTCDETAAAVVERLDDGRARSCPTWCCRQIDEHAALRRRGARRSPRAPMSRRSTMIIGQGHGRRRHALSPNLDGIAAAAGPGLIGGVIVGLTTAKAIALVERKAADRGQPSRSPCAHRAAHRQRAVSLLPVPGLRRPHPDRRRARRRRLYAARHHAWTTPSAKPSTRPRSCSGLGYPGGPQVEKEAARGNADALRAAAADAAAARTPTSRCRA